jgi:hypothetical protein
MLLCTRSFNAAMYQELQCCQVGSFCCQAEASVLQGRSFNAVRSFNSAGNELQCCFVGASMLLGRNYAAW